MNACAQLNFEALCGACGPYPKGKGKWPGLVQSMQYGIGAAWLDLIKMKEDALKRLERFRDSWHRLSAMGKPITSSSFSRRGDRRRNAEWIGLDCAGPYRAAHYECWELGRPVRATTCGVLYDEAREKMRRYNLVCESPSRGFEQSVSC
jgi:hypothetical protein